ncbi:MAG: YceI family protein [Verrucomicrobia bacterium]|nr:YceI family protein [Verrucomicrobiota bacterium]
MKKLLRYAFATGTGLLVALLATAQAPAPASNSCHAIFRGSSTFHDFAGAVDASLVQAAFDRDTWRIRIEFPVAAMNTKNASRDKNMLRMFEPEKFPVIVAAANNLPYPDRAPPATLTGTLKIRDHEQPGAAMLENFSLKDGTTSFTLKGEVSLAAFQLKPPSAALGMIRVGDKVKLDGHVILHNWPQRPGQP